MTFLIQGEAASKLQADQRIKAGRDKGFVSGRGVQPSPSSGHSSSQASGATGRSRGTYPDQMDESEDIYSLDNVYHKLIFEGD